MIQYELERQASWLKLELLCCLKDSQEEFRQFLSLLGAFPSPPPRCIAVGLIVLPFVILLTLLMPAS